MGDKILCNNCCHWGRIFKNLNSHLTLKSFKLHNFPPDQTVQVLFKKKPIVNKCFPEMVYSEQNCLINVLSVWITELRGKVLMGIFSWKINRVIIGGWSWKRRCVTWSSCWWLTNWNYQPIHIYQVLMVSVIRFTRCLVFWDWVSWPAVFHQI